MQDNYPWRAETLASQNSDHLQHDHPFQPLRRINYAIALRKGEPYIASEIDSGGMCVFLVPLDKADRWDTADEAEAFLRRCVERYPSEGLHVVACAAEPAPLTFPDRPCYPAEMACFSELDPCIYMGPWPRWLRWLMACSAMLFILGLCTRGHLWH